MSASGKIYKVEEITEEGFFSVEGHGDFLKIDKKNLISGFSDEDLLHRLQH